MGTLPSMDLDWYALGAGELADLIGAWRSLPVPNDMDGDDGSVGCLGPMADMVLYAPGPGDCMALRPPSRAAVPMPNMGALRRVLVDCFPTPSGSKYCAQAHAHARKHTTGRR